LHEILDVNELEGAILSLEQMPNTAFPELFALLTQKLTDLSSRQLVS
jgi:hypothetical protein